MNSPHGSVRIAFKPNGVPSHSIQMPSEAIASFRKALLESRDTKPEERRLWLEHKVNKEIAYLKAALSYLGSLKSDISEDKRRLELDYGNEQRRQVLENRKLEEAEKGVERAKNALAKHLATVQGEIKSPKAYEKIRQSFTLMQAIGDELGVRGNHLQVLRQMEEKWGSDYFSFMHIVRSSKMASKLGGMLAGLLSPKSDAAVVLGTELAREYFEKFEYAVSFVPGPLFYNYLVSESRGTGWLEEMAQGRRPSRLPQAEELADSLEFLSEKAHEMRLGGMTADDACKQLNANIHKASVQISNAKRIARVSNDGQDRETAAMALQDLPIAIEEMQKFLRLSSSLRLLCGTLEKSLLDLAGALQGYSIADTKLAEAQEAKRKEECARKTEEGKLGELKERLDGINAWMAQIGCTQLAAEYRLQKLEHAAVHKERMRTRHIDASPRVNPATAEKQEKVKFIYIKEPETEGPLQAAEGGEQKRMRAFLQMAGERFAAFLKPYPQQKKNFDYTLGELAKIYLENGGRISFGMVMSHRVLGPRARHEYPFQRASQGFKLIRIAIESSRTYRIIIECSDPANPLILFAGIKSESDKFMNNGKFLEAYNKAVEGKNSNLFPALLPPAQK